MIIIMDGDPESRVSFLYMTDCIQGKYKRGNYKSIAYNYGQDTRTTVALITPRYIGQSYQNRAGYYPLESGTVVAVDISLTRPCKLNGERTTLSLSRIDENLAETKGFVSPSAS